MSLTSKELELIEKIGSLADDFRATMLGGNEEIIENDMFEVVSHLRPLQLMVMAQSAGRAHPSRVRMMGYYVLDQYDRTKMKPETGKDCCGEKG